MELLDNDRLSITVRKPVDKLLDGDIDQELRAKISKGELDEDFKSQTSSSSCYLSDITGIIFGGLSSRFWILRKHFNSMSLGELKYIPFFSWQCFTLCMNHRDVHLIVSNEQVMDDFLLVLIYALNTVDGTKGSAEPIL